MCPQFADQRVGVLVCALDGRDAVELDAQRLDIGVGVKIRRTQTVAVELIAQRRVGG